MTDPRQLGAGDLSDSKVVNHRESLNGSQDGGPARGCRAWERHGGARFPFKQRALDLKRTFCFQALDQC